jgi:hypothetical protein
LAMSSIVVALWPAAQKRAYALRTMRARLGCLRLACRRGSLDGGHRIHFTSGHY